MSYLVLARKYRPQTFEQVIGQEHVTKTLQNAITRGRIHHAFLFCGGRGTGKTTTARILAKALSCVNAPTAQPCNVCPACVEITQGTSVDVQEIDAASQNRVEDIRDLREAIRYAPVRGKKKLYILDEVHMLSTSAFNALLKTLEEPPPHAVFVFATTDPHKLPQTILSRVQRYDFKLVPTSRLVEHLADVLGRENIEFERSALHLIAREGAGSVRDSLSLLDQVLASVQGPLSESQAAAVLGVADRGLVLGLARAILGRNASEALTLIAQAYERGFDLVQLARTLLAHLRDLLVVSVVQDPLPLLDGTEGELEELRAQAALAKGRVELLFDRMLRVAEDTARASLTRYVLEVGLVELCGVEPLQPIGELLERLELMEERLAGKAPHTGGRSGGAAGGPASGRPPAAPAAPPASQPAGRTSAAAPSERPPASVPAPTPPPAKPMMVSAAAAPAVSPVAAPARQTIEHVVPAIMPAAVAPAPQPVRDPAPAPAPPVAAAPAPAAVPMPAAAAPPAAVPPPAAAADPGAPITYEEFIRATKRICEDPKTQPLSFLWKAKPLVLEADRLLLGHPEFNVRLAQDRATQIADAYSAALNRPVRVEHKFDPQAQNDSSGRRSLGEEEEEARNAERVRRRREAMEHAARGLVREVFGEVSFLEPMLEPEVNVHG